MIIYIKKSRGSIGRDDEIDPISNELDQIQINIKDESSLVISLDQMIGYPRRENKSQREDIRHSKPHVYPQLALQSFVKIHITDSRIRDVTKKVFESGQIRTHFEFERKLSSNSDS